MTRFDYIPLKELLISVFKKNLFTPKDSEDISDVIIMADLFGIESHGMQRLQYYIDNIDQGRAKVHSKPDIIKETKLSALIDANMCMGQIVSMQATDMAIEKALEHGMSMVCVRNSNHYGIAGYYARKMAQSGLLGMCFTNSEPIMVPTFGKQAMLGTNPVAVAMNAEPHMFLFDASTAVVTRGKIEVYIKKEQPMPAGWAVDSQGNETSDAKTIDDCIFSKSGGGGILPLGGFTEESGGHKGYGFGLMVEVLTGIFASGFTSDLVRHHEGVEGSCHTFLAIDYGMFGSKADIEASLSNYLEKIRSSARHNEQQCIYTHGQKEALAYEDRIKNGIYLDDKTVLEVKAICKRYDLSPEKYLKEV